MGKETGVCVWPQPCNTTARHISICTARQVSCFTFIRLQLVSILSYMNVFSYRCNITTNCLKKGDFFFHFWSLVLQTPNLISYQNWLIWTKFEPTKIWLIKNPVVIYNTEKTRLCETVLFTYFRLRSIKMTFPGLASSEGLADRPDGQSARRKDLGPIWMDGSCQPLD